jgi:hypothetical protein
LAALGLAVRGRADTASSQQPVADQKATKDLSLMLWNWEEGREGGREGGRERGRESARASAKTAEKTCLRFSGYRGGGQRRGADPAACQREKTGWVWGCTAAGLLVAESKNRQQRTCSRPALTKIVPIVSHSSAERSGRIKPGDFFGASAHHRNGSVSTNSNSNSWISLSS